MSASDNPANQRGAEGRRPTFPPSVSPQGEETKLREAARLALLRLRAVRGKGLEWAGSIADQLDRAMLPEPPGGLSSCCKPGGTCVTTSSLPIAPDRLFDLIKHGDDEHQAWLKEAIHAAYRGEPVPAVAGSGRKEARIAELEAQLAARPAIAPDHVLVPREMTPEMVAAFYRGYRDDHTLSAAWEAILTASPQPPSHGQGEVEKLALELRKDVAATREVLALRGDTASLAMLDRVERAADLLAPPSSGEAEAVARALEIAAEIEVQADCLERYAEQSGHAAKPVPSVLHIQASHFRAMASALQETLAFRLSGEAPNPKGASA